MAVYVDDMAYPFKPAHRPDRTYVLCHMMADTTEELHAMADTIGVARNWFQPARSGDHYDISKSKRALAIAAGAIEISQREMAAYAWHRRVHGFVCLPSVAHEKFCSALRAKATPHQEDRSAQ